MRCRDLKEMAWFGETWSFTSARETGRSTDEPGAQLPKIDLPADAQITRDLRDLLERLGYICAFMAQEAGDVLDRAGDQRLRSKSRFFSRLLADEAPGPSANGPDLV